MRHLIKEEHTGADGNSVSMPHPPPGGNAAWAHHIRGSFAQSITYGLKAQ